MVTAPSPDSSTPPTGVDGVQDVGESLNHSQGSSASKINDQEVVSGVPKATSWVKVVQETKGLRKYSLEITESEGLSNIEIPDEVVVNADPLWEDFLIGKFLDTAPHIARIHAVVNKIWREGGKGQFVEVYEVDSTTMKFRVPDAAMRARILRRGMWNIGNIPLVVTKWIPDELMEKPEIKSIPMWVYLKNVPMNMFSWKGLSFITSAVGHPVRLHPETASCANFKLAKIFVNADLSKELPKKINFTKNGKSSLVEFLYPRLPTRCNTCGKWGHLEKDCVMNKKDETFKSVAEIIEQGLKQNEKEKAKQTETVPEQNGSEETTQTKEVNNSEVEVEEGEVLEEWSNVTPGRACKSPKLRILEYGQVKIASRFSALDDADDNGDLVKEKGEQETEAGEKENVPPVGEQSDETQDVLKTGEVNTDIEAGSDSIVAAGMEKENIGKPEMRDRVGSVEEEGMRDQERSVEEVRKGENQSLLGNSNLRPSLPRNSKTNHKIVPSKDTEIPGPQGKRTNRKPSQ